MKTINLNMKAELTGGDLLQAIVEGADPKQLLETVLQTPGVMSTYLLKHRTEVTKAVTNFMAKEHALKTDKVIYQNGKVLVEARTIGQPVAAKETVRERVAPEGHSKKNKGIFEYLREYLDDERKKKNKELDFKVVYEDAKFFYPKLTPRLLQIYLHDKRQLKGIDFSAKRGTVILKGA